MRLEGVVGLGLEGVDALELAADEASYEGLLYVVARMDGLEEALEEGFEVAALEGAVGVGILYVGLCQAEGVVDGLAVVELACEEGYLGLYEDVGVGDGLAELQAVEGGAAAQGHVGLPAGEDAAREVDHGAAEGEALALVDGDGPCQAEGELGEHAELLLLYLLLLCRCRCSACCSRWRVPRRTRGRSR
jgi:hypothetical protein